MSEDNRGTKSIFSSLAQTPVTLKKCLVNSDHGKREIITVGVSVAGSGQAGPSDSKRDRTGMGKGGVGVDRMGQDRIPAPPPSPTTESHQSWLPPP